MNLPEKITVQDKTIIVSDLNDGAKRVLADILSAERMIADQEAGLRLMRLSLATLKSKLDEDLSSSQGGN